MSITERPIELAERIEGPSNARCGAAVTFVGIVRSRNGGREVTGIAYDCYREMAEAEIERIIGEIERSYGVSEIHVTHRVGHVAVGEVSLLVAVWSEHRQEAFDATQAVVSELKHRVPIWKKELYADATSQWI